MEFFLLRGDGRPDDIKTSDFLDKEWYPTGVHVDRLSEAVTELDKRLAHLTRQRHKPFEGWMSSLITGDLMCLNDEFLAQLEGREAATWFDEARAASETSLLIGVGSMTSCDRNPRQANGVGVPVLTQPLP